MFAVDENGLTGEATRLVQPMMVSVDVDSSPPGRTIVVDGEPITAFEEVLSWQNHEMTIEVEDEPPYLFQKWSDGETSRERSEILNTTNVFSAIFCVGEGGSCDGDDSVVCCEGPCNEVGICGEMENVSATTSMPTEQQVGDDSLGDIDVPSVSVTEDPDGPSLSEDESSVTRESDESLSGGAKAGISIVAVGIVAGLIVFFVRRSKEGSGGGKASGSINSNETMDSPSRDAAEQPTLAAGNKIMAEGEVADEAPPSTVGVEAAIL